MQLIDIGLAFIEGLALIVSPCILPILPLVLSASIAGGRQRPFGIIVGFIVAFSAFTLLSHKLVELLHINLDYLKYTSLLLLGLFGLILLSNKLSNIFASFTQGLANIGGDLSANLRDGFGSGIFIGMLIGLIWTPCAGPILAAVLVQVIRQQSDSEALFVVAAFAFGAGVPMLLIALMGRKLMTKLRFLSVHADLMRKILGGIILLAVVFSATNLNAGLNAGTLFNSTNSSATASSTQLQGALANPYPAPEFLGIQAWLNSKPLTMASLKGKVVLVDFWTYSCINCIRTLPYITKWDQLYRDKGLVIIGVQAPEFEFEKNQTNVAAAIAEHNIKYPVALDNNLDTWTNFANHYWPAHYLIDKNGQIVYTHFGEGSYAETENNIRVLLGLNIKTTPEPEAIVFSREQTPETYLGYARSENFASVEPIARDTIFRYSIPKYLPVDNWALSGSWKIESERIISADKDSALQLNFTAGKVYLVLGTTDGTQINASVSLNGEPLSLAAGKDAPAGVLTIKRHTLYELVNQKNVRNGLLEIKANKPGLEAYAFTFGS